MDGAINACVVDEQLFPAHCKLAAALLYIRCCSTAESISLLGSYYLESGRWVVLGFVIRCFGIWYALCATLFVCDGTYQDLLVFECVDRIQS